MRVIPRCARGCVCVFVAVSHGALQKQAEFASDPELPLNTKQVSECVPCDCFPSRRRVRTLVVDRDDVSGKVPFWRLRTGG